MTDVSGSYNKTKHSGKWWIVVVGIAWWVCLQPVSTSASTFSYGFMVFQTEPPREQPQHQIMLTDGYCMFLDHNGPFNRLCFEGGVGFRFVPGFAFDLHPQLVLHHVWLRPLFYGAFFSIGPMFTVYPGFFGGFRVSAGFHLYFVAPSVEYQLAVDTQGNVISRVLLQLTIPLPTGSINFAMGNVGL